MSKYSKDHLKYRIKGKTIEEYPMCKRWLNNRKPHKVNTKRNLKGALQQYVKFMGMTPDEIINDGKRLNQNNHQDFINEHYNHLIDFKNHLMNERGSAESTINQRLSSVLDFYNFNLLAIPERFYKNIYVDNPQQKSGNKARITYDDIEYALDKVVESPMMRAFILVGISTGLACDDITTLTVGDV
ncbi:MAG: hypothetical protein ACOCP4_03480 [Candidatus Woesearchaeota archaeon]